MSGDVDMLGQMIMFGSLKSELCEFCGQKIFWAAALFSPALIAFRPTAGNIIVKISNCICQNHKIYFSKSQYNCSIFHILFVQITKYICRNASLPFLSSHFDLLFNLTLRQVYKNALGHIYVAEVMKRGEGENSTEQVDQIQFGMVKTLSSTPQVEKIFLDVKTALERILNQTTWMDVET